MKNKSNFKANFLWPFREGTIEEVGYEFANAKTEPYRKLCWDILVERMKPSNLLTPCSYRLPWSRFVNGNSWEKAEVVATKFEDNVPVSWAIREGGSVLGKDGEWEYEPSPSNRDQDFFSKFRYDTAEEAALIAEKFMKVEL